MNRRQMLQECVESIVNSFLFNPVIKNEKLYENLLGELEKPLLRATLKFYKNNQTQAAKALGFNRGTLRKKMRKYHIKLGGVL